MKFRWWYGVVFNMILAALVIFGAAFYIKFVRPAGPTDSPAPRRDTGDFLEIRDAGSGKLFGSWPLEGKKEFALEFIHSVHQSPVRETFVIEEKMIRPLAVRFSSFGAGMLSDLGEGEVMSRDGDAMVISGFKTSLKEINLIVGTVSDHLLFVNGETISLRELCGRNAHITIRCF